MTIRFATPAEIADWDALVLKNPAGGNVFASHEVATIKAANGWQPRYIIADNIAVLALEKRIPLLGKFWYLPKGPEVGAMEQLTELLPPLREFAKNHKVFAFKIEPELPQSQAATAALETLGAVRTFAVQPNASTVLIDLTPAEDEILASLNQKGRHAIRRAERDGVTARAVEFTDENCQIMYELLRETAEGQWNLRPYEYFFNFWKAFADTNRGQMFFAYHGGEVVAASFGLLFGEKATYKDGASTRQRTAYGASHLLQWEMIKWMKARGATLYDLCGAPSAAEIHDTTHRLYGVGRFKTSFNKQITEYVGAYTVPCRGFIFRIWSTVGERITLRLHAARHHTEWY